MSEVTGLQAVAWGLQDGGVEFVTAYPGFHAHELAELLALKRFSVNEKTAFAIAWGASLAGVRSATMFKNVGLNDAADPYINACMLGVWAGMVLVVLDDVDMEQSQIFQDSRPYAEFPCSLWLEPRSVADAYEQARQAPELSERLETLVVLRITNALVRAVGSVRRREPLTGRRKWSRAPERWVSHPVYSEAQRKRLETRQEAIARWVDEAYPKPGNFEGTVVRIAAGMATSLAKAPPHLSVFTLPIPRSWFQALAASGTTVHVEEHGSPYISQKVAAAIGAARVTPHPVRPEVERHYRVTERYEPLYALLRQLPNRVVVGDLGGHTLDPHRTVDACLCYGCSVAVATGLAIADPSLHVVCVTGDAALRHSGKAAIEEAIARGAAITVFVLDNGGSISTGGQSLPGSSTFDIPGAQYHHFEFSILGQPNALATILHRRTGLQLVHLKTPF